MSAGTGRVNSSLRAVSHVLGSTPAVLRRWPASLRGPVAGGGVRVGGAHQRDGGPAQAGRFLWLEDPGAGPRA